MHEREGNGEVNYVTSRECVECGDCGPDDGIPEPETELDSRQRCGLERIEEDEARQLAVDLVAIASGPGSGTREVAEFLHAFLESRDIESQIEAVHGQEHCNLVACLPGREPGYGLMLNGHIDTVPDAKPPQHCHVAKGVLYGRGSADMKGGVAAMCMAIVNIGRSCQRLKRGVILTAVAGEEHGGFGTRSFLESGRRADLAIVGEPTNLGLVTAHKGVEWTRITVQGEPGHASRVNETGNAISCAARIALLLERNVELSTARHPQLGGPTLNIGSFHGGASPNVIPGTCEFTVDRRWLPCESIEGIYETYEEAVAQVIKGVAGMSACVERCDETRHAVPVSTPLSSRVVEALRAVLEKRGLPSTPRGVSYATDAAWLSSYGIPVAVLGPGDIAHAHSDREFVDLRQVRIASEIYTETILAICGERS